ncbi:MAG: phosphoribosylamine--glycine ligase [Bryobacteraceae bacterium]
MKIQIIGGGGREHALAWRLAKSPQVTKLIANPGNPGIAALAECTPAPDIYACLQAAEQSDVDLTVVGPEVPLVAGIVDLYRAKGRLIFGPTAAAAQLEGSKTFSKQFMTRAGIPTARFVTVTNLEDARNALQLFSYPVVLKADGLAAGKGVVIAQDKQEAQAALPSLLAGGRLVMEEFLAGEEVSFIVLSDGTTALPLQPSQDHKAAYDGDTGPNTGGMGAYCDSRILTPQQTQVIMDTVIEPTIATMRSEGTPFTGFLYAGLMMTADGPRVLEFNARLGDPETQALMHRMDSDFAAVLHAGARGDLKQAKMQWKDDPSVCVVLAAHGYPGTVRTGDLILGIENADADVFHAGTRMGPNGLETSGGRVLGVTASAPSLRAAIAKTYDAVNRIHFDGMHYRRDIGKKGLTRYNNTVWGRSSAG